MVHIVLNKDTHKSLWMFKFNNDFKTFDDAIKFLLSKKKYRKDNDVEWTDSEYKAMCERFAEEYSAGDVSYQDLADKYGLYKQKVLRMAEKGRVLRDNSVNEVNCVVKKDFIKKVLDFEARRFDYDNWEDMDGECSFEEIIEDWMKQIQRFKVLKDDVKVALEESDG